MTATADVRWIGGGSGAGKSTVARILARRLGARVVSTDDSIARHAVALRSEPRVRAFVEASMDERWLLRDPEEMLRTFPWFAGDGFDLLLREVHAADGPLIVEGFRLLPRQVAPLLAKGGSAVWLLPTPEQRLRALRGRSGSEAFWQRTSAPDRAFANVLERDRLFTERLRSEARALGLQTVDVDGEQAPAALAARIAPLLSS